MTKKILFVSPLFFLGVTGLFSTTGCTTNSSVALDYAASYNRSAFSDQSLQTDGAPQPRTVIFFLVDGLPYNTLRDEASHGRLPQITQFFLGPNQPLFKAHTIFPSLTYPSISTFLTSSPVDQHQVLGNQFYRNGRLVNYEALGEKENLNDQIDSLSIFTRLKTQKRSTVSFDYSFYKNSSAHTFLKDIEAGLAIVEKNYHAVDVKQIDSLNNLLRDTPIDHWPDFIFVHLVGVDLLSHDLGPQAPYVYKYLENLDVTLGDTFNILTHAEQRHDRIIVSILSADHGFDEPVSRFVNFPERARLIDPRIVVVNEGRFASVFFPKDWSEDKRANFLDQVNDSPDIDMTARAYGDQVYIRTENQLDYLKFQKQESCPDGFALTSSRAAEPNVFRCPETYENDSTFYPFLIVNLAHYFQAPGHPDALIIPKPGVSFSTQYHGQHGGPTPGEVIIPLLMRNARPAEVGSVMPSSEVLKFVLDP